MEDFTDYPVGGGGPADGLTLTFPSGFEPDLVSFWVRGLKGCPHLHYQYRLNADRKQYRHSGWSWESEGADFSDELWPQPFANVKGYGRLTEWVRLQDMSM